MGVQPIGGLLGVSRVKFLNIVKRPSLPPTHKSLTHLLTHLPGIHLNLKLASAHPGSQFKYRYQAPGAGTYIKYFAYKRQTTGLLF